MPRRDFLASFIQPFASVISPGQRHVPLRIQRHRGGGSLRLKLIMAAVSDSQHSLDDGPKNHTANSNNIQNQGLAKVREEWRCWWVKPYTKPQSPAVFTPPQNEARQPWTSSAFCCSSPKWELSVPVLIRLTAAVELAHTAASTVPGNHHCLQTELRSH